MGHRKEPRFPDGTLGIILSSSDERRQEDIFHPTLGYLVAVNVNGDPTFGSIVYDLNKSNQPDGERGAYLQSIFRVIKEPFGVENSIAIQLGPAGQSDSGGGLFCDIGDGSNAAITEIAIGHGSYSQNGCLHVGHANDRHRLDMDADGNPINPLHIWARFNLYKNKKEDGPLRIEPYLPPDKDLDKRIPVHFGWDDGAKDWAWYTTSQFYLPPGEKSIDPKIPKINDKGPHPIVVPRPGTIEFPAISDSNEFVPFVDATTGHIALTPADFEIIDQKIKELERQEGADAWIKNAPIITGDNRVGLPLGLAFSDGLIATAGYAMRAQNWNDNQVDTGVISPSQPGSAKGLTSNPITGVMSCFSAQGGAITNASGQTTYTGGEGDPHVYTQVPRGRKETGKPTSKFIGGTADGGMVIHPPEVDLRDAGDGMVPDNVTLSTTYLICAPNAYFGAGTPELVSGSIKDGFSWGTDSSTGDLVFYSHSASQGQDEAVRFAKSSQWIQWRSGTNFTGSIYHNITANRTWLFPNLTGSVSLNSVTNGLFTPGAVIFGASDGSQTEDSANLFFDDSQNYLGIGINSSLAAPLHISASHATTTPQIIINQADTGDAGLRMSLGTTQSMWIGYDNSTSDLFVFSTAASGTATADSTNVLTISTAGVVTIPNLTASRIVHTSSSASGGFLTTNNNLTYDGTTLEIIVANGQTNLSLRGTSARAFQIGTDASGDGFFYIYNSSDVAVIQLDADTASLINNGQDFAIGNASPSARLHVTESAVGNEVFRIETTATNDDPSDRYFHGRVATTNNTITTINTIAIAASTTVLIEAFVRARRTGGAAGTAEDGAGYVVRATYKNVAGTATLIGTVNADYTAEDQAGWDATFNVSSGNVLLQVTGATDNNVTWHSTVVTRLVSS